MTWYLHPEKNASGAYPSPQSLAFPGAIPLDDEQAAALAQCGGFAAVECTEDGVRVTPDEEAYRAYCASLSPAEETDE